MCTYCMVPKDKTCLLSGFSQLHINTIWQTKAYKVKTVCNMQNQLHSFAFRLCYLLWANVETCDLNISHTL